VLQQLEYSTMAMIHAADADQSAQRPATERDPLKDRRASARPSSKNNPPLAGDGLELIRSNDC
jgi:hypothetical protein